MFIYKRCNCETKPKDSPSKKKPSSLPGLLKLVSVPNRLSILILLGDGPHCVCDIVTHSKMSQTLVSHHLSDLLDAGLIESKKKGQFVDYSLTKKGSVVLIHLEKISNL